MDITSLYQLRSLQGLPGSIHSPGPGLCTAGLTVGRKRGKLMQHPVRVLSGLVFVSAVPALAACSAGTMSQVASGQCDAAAAQTLIGKPQPTDEEARRVTGATTARQIAPGQPVTHDYRAARVTVETNCASGRVVRAACG
ncbi:I78 family peptidase inhibitor [Rhizobium ruizarguesonis]|uniref:I78 family peptidase inhibitor n=1 Tax=Rhizobium ruizarguesonis TaxID=2081791 RepID=UPI00296224E7|nr:I78 family peptidase inhibitor [Rhizobium ruizarguesonis]